MLLTATCLVIYASLTYLSLHDICPQSVKVTVIGNGALSQKAKNATKGANCVIRFNHMHGYYPGAPVHAVALREHTMKLSQHRRSIPVIPVISNRSQLRPLNASSLAPIYITQNHVKEKPEYKRLKLFSRCKRWKFHTNVIARNGPSTGAAVIDFLEKHPDVRAIDVWGFNWNGTRRHVDFLYPRLVRDCCTKCTIHKMHTRDYSPRRKFAINTKSSTLGQDSKNGAYRAN